MWEQVPESRRAGIGEGFCGRERLRERNYLMSSELKQTILRLAGELGFVASVAPVDGLARLDRFERFLAQGYHADMQWLARSPAGRFEPASLLEGAKSVICLAAPYGPGDFSSIVALACGTAALGCAALALYARGRDYHRLLKKRCGQLVDGIRQLAGPVQMKICVDTATISERSLAARAGLGWIGRNGCLIHRRYGSFVFLAEIVTDLALPPDEPARSRCGRCRRCIDACPTGALQADGLVNCRRCISYLTIEHPGRIDEPLMERMGERVFGCDACQAVCPWNRRHERGWEEFAQPMHEHMPSPREILRWRPEEWDAFTRGSATRRATYEMFLRNAAVVAGNARDAACRADLERLAKDGPEIVRSAAAWALRQL